MSQTIPQFARDMERAQGRLTRGSSKAAKRAGQIAVFSGKTRIVQQDAVASTELFRSMGSRRLGPTRVLIQNTAPHAGFVDRGTGIYGPYPAGNPPVGAILEWMRLKPTFVMPPNPGGQLRVAQTIKSNIRERGTKAQPFFDDAVEDGFDAAKSELRAAFRSAF